MTLSALEFGGGGSEMTVDAATVRLIADRLEDAEQIRDDALAELRALLNGTHAGAVRAESDAGPTRPESAGSTPAPRSTQVPEALPVATPAAGDRTSPRSASGTPFRCGDCDRSFPSAQALGAHRRHAHPGPKQLAALARREAGEPVIRSRTYLCRFCSASFKNKLDLDFHEASHPAPPKGQPVGRPGLIDQVRGR